MKGNKYNIVAAKLNQEVNDTYSLQYQVLNDLRASLNKKVENYFVEALKRKGYEFKNPIELEVFIKSNCRCEHQVGLKQRTYFVNDIPFFLHCYEVKMNLNPICTDGEVKMSANYSSLRYL